MMHRKNTIYKNQESNGGLASKHKIVNVWQNDEWQWTVQSISNAANASGHTLWGLLWRYWHHQCVRHSWIHLWQEQNCMTWHIHRALPPLLLGGCCRFHSVSPSIHYVRCFWYRIPLSTVCDMCLFSEFSHYSRNDADKIESDHKTQYLVQSLLLFRLYFFSCII